MNPLRRELQLRREILRALDSCDGLLLPEDALLHGLRLAVAPAPLGSEFAAALEFLEAQKLIVGVRPRLGGPPKWKLSDEGRAELATL